MNVNKTKVMRFSPGKKVYEKSGRWPCGVCRKGVGVNFVLCGKCGQGVHARSSGMKGKLQAAGFECRGCKDDVRCVEMGVLKRGYFNVETTEKFCYLGDVFRKDGGSD